MILNIWNVFLESNPNSDPDKYFFFRTAKVWDLKNMRTAVATVQVTVEIGFFFQETVTVKRINSKNYLFIFMKKNHVNICSSLTVQSTV